MSSFILSLLKNVFGPGRGWPLIAADDFHQPRGKSGDSCDLSAMHGNSITEVVTTLIIDAEASGDVYC
jgi:hypothetical protein